MSLSHPSTTAHTSPAVVSSDHLAASQPLPSFLACQLPAGHWYEAIDIEARLVAEEGTPGGQAQTIVAKYAGTASEAHGWQMVMREQEFSVVDRAIPPEEAAPSTAPVPCSSNITPSVVLPMLPAAAADLTRSSQSQPQLADALTPSIKSSKSSSIAVAPLPPRSRNDLPKRESALGAQKKFAPAATSQPTADTSANREAARTGALNWHVARKGDAAGGNERKRQVHKVFGSKTNGDVTLFHGQWLSTDSVAPAFALTNHQGLSFSPHVPTAVHWCNANGEPMDKRENTARTLETEERLRDSQDKLEEFRARQRARAAAIQPQVVQKAQPQKFNQVSNLPFSY